MTEIGGGAFVFCTGLTRVVILDGVTSICNSMFAECTGLESIVIPDSVTSIGWSAFYGCTALTSIVIPDSVTEIGISAFYGCTALKSVVFENPEGWRDSLGNEISSEDLSDPAVAASLLVNGDVGSAWERVTL